MSLSETKNQVSKDFNQGKQFMAIYWILLANINGALMSIRCCARFWIPRPLYYFSTLILHCKKMTYPANNKTLVWFSILKINQRHINYKKS